MSAKKSPEHRREYMRTYLHKYSREYYRRNIAKYKERSKKRMAARMQIMQQLKDKPCMDCGVKYPYYVMDFDHRDPKTKKFNLSLVGQRSMKSVLEEIAKCDLVCSNCHRARTHRKRLALNT